MPNKPEGVKKSAKQAMEERQVEMAAEFARLQEAVHLEEEEERRQREEKKIKGTGVGVIGAHGGVDDIRLLVSPATPKVRRNLAAPVWSIRGDCTWTQASRSNRIQNCDVCLQLKAQCSSGVPPVSIDKGKKRERAEGTPSPRAKGKKRQQSLVEMDDDVEVISNPQTVIAEEGRWTEYDDQAWVATANNIVAALARTNGLLERSIAVAEGSRAAMDRFMEEQRAFQALFLEAARNGFHVEAAEEPEETEVEVEGGSGAGVSGGDMETDDL
ncbi:uncharacterized protein EDB91DRAFT_1086731 [Suillus paluster]|uniref:uncharacterized protein n=1 Tax=Suillus paluster TaxID=48578 RepID=UPI001B864BBF|nr:uncharacterized protein EDB91DRAFT_1086731 [Suillus paluster]KAG1726648.1 hypothetical protein EDB91DRAFT_1086731 [Suillus paluster]